MSRRAVLAAGLAVGLAVLIAGCTGVPSSSAPQTVVALNTGAPSGGPTQVPPANADPDTIVDGFLTANTNETARHGAARAYLTAAARNRWSDTIATVISDESQPTFNAATRTVTVFGRVVGSVNTDGIYTPTLDAQGEGGQRQPFEFTLAKVGGQWRIDKLRSGLLVTSDQFRDAFQPHVVYFYDAAEQYLVPDLRWSALADRTQLADWLLSQLVNPRPELQNTVSTDTLPAAARNITVALGTPTRIEIPGSSQLDPGVRDHLAAQVSQTLLEPLSGRAITITDGGRPVTIPAVGGTQFTASQFTSATGPPTPEPAVYYLTNGRVTTESGKPMSGPLGDGGTFLNSFAVHRDHTGALLVAGVQGTGSAARLVVGTQHAGVRPTSVRGRLTRPAFAPGRTEAWVGVGARLYRVTISGTRGVASQVAIPSAAGGGRIVAVRLSPDGSRVALVIAGATPGSGQLWIGSIVRATGQVRIDVLTLISPKDVTVQDVAWLDSLKLFAIGSPSGSREGRTFQTGVDGSEWTNSSTSNLPAAPDSVTVAPAANVWVSANGLVWQQSGSQWVSPVATGQTPGTMPVYLE